MGQSIYDFKIKSSNNQEIDFSQFKGKKIMITNIATKCGFTPQLDGMEKLHKDYSEKENLVIVGLPSNDFGGQTPEDEKGVEAFCQLNYGVSFPLSEKIKVKGKEKHPLVAFLEEQRGGLLKGIKWNFEKFLFDENGNYVDSFRSITKPESNKVKAALGLK